MRNGSANGTAGRQGWFGRLLAPRNLINLASLIATVIALAIAVYVRFDEPEPAITYRITNQTDFVNIDRPIESLRIWFDGTFISGQSNNLRFVTIAVENTGQTDISQGDYAQESDWGILFEDASIIDAWLIRASSEYLLEGIRPQLVPDMTNDGLRNVYREILFEKIIFEESSQFVIEVLLLHSTEEEPTIIPIGKIIGIEEIIVLEEPIAEPEAGFFSRAFSGNFVTQAVRSIAYTALGIYAALLGYTITDDATGVVKKRARARRKRRARRSLTCLITIKNDQLKRNLLSLYETDGAKGLARLLEIVREPGRISWVTPEARWVFNLPDSSTNRSSEITNRAWNALLAMDVLEHSGDGHAIADPDLSKAIIDLLDELES